jgi:spore germination protein KC
LTKHKHGNGQGKGRGTMEQSMTLKKNKFILVALLIMSTFITGCWDYKELDDQIIIFGTAIDYNQENKGIILTAEITLPTSSGKESNFSSKIYQGKGQNLMDAIVDLQSKAGRRLLWSHSKVLILSEDIIGQEKLFVGIMDWIKRAHEIRDTVWLLTTHEKTAAEILQKSNPQTQKIISAYLDGLFLAGKSETFLDVHYSKFIKDLQSATVCAALPTIRLEDSPNGILPLLDGTALYYRTKEVGWLDGKRTRVLLLLMNQLKQAVFVPEPSDNHKVNGVSLKMDYCQTDIKPILGPKGLVMEIDIKMEAQIGEIDGEQDVFTPDKIKKLIKGAQSEITAQINELLQLLQKDYQCDVLGFGNKVEAKHPKFWKKIKNRWPNEYAQIPTAIHLKLSIFGSQESKEVTKVGP